MRFEALGVALAVWLGGVDSALAHAPPEATGIFWTNDGNAERAVVRTNRGLIFQAATTGSFSLLCGEAFKSTVTELVPFAVVPDGTVLVGSYEGGLQTSSPDQCNFAKPAKEVAGLYTIDIQANPAQPEELFALTLPLDGSAGALLTRPTTGASFHSLATVEGAPDSLRVSAADPDRVYVVSMRSEGSQQIADVLTSFDHGKSFTITSLELEEQEIRAYLLEGGRTDKDRVLLRTETADGVVPERLLLSEDGGLTFRDVYRARGPLSFVSSPDGRTWWLGAFDGVFRSTNGGRSFEAISGAPERVGCLTWHGDKLYVCGHFGNEFGVLATSDTGTHPFDWFLRFPQVRSRLSCSADSNEGLTCEYPFEDWVSEQLETGGGVPALGEGGVSSGMPPAGEHTTTPTRVGSSCSIGFPGAQPANWLSLALFCLMVPISQLRQRLARAGQRPRRAEMQRDSASSTALAVSGLLEFCASDSEHASYRHRLLLGAAEHPKIKTIHAN